ncbi:hypothetical protein M9Y10_033131 [Tritrichomonas musculus]|uniref:Uncharacterized protein n=1 Tax=Tritrichomonas musculus TaxID=1915356 RepID=A0ABR2GXY7_9EUKA
MKIHHGTSQNSKRTWESIRISNKDLKWGAESTTKALKLGAGNTTNESKWGANAKYYSSSKAPAINNGSNSANNTKEQVINEERPEISNSVISWTKIHNENIPSLEIVSNNSDSATATQNKASETLLSTNSNTKETSFVGTRTSSSSSLLSNKSGFVSSWWETNKTKDPASKELSLGASSNNTYSSSSTALSTNGSIESQWKVNNNTKEFTRKETSSGAKNNSNGNSSSSTSKILSAKNCLQKPTITVTVTVVHQQL